MTMKPTRRFAGFTLIELMVVVVTIAILSAIAFPSYQSYIRKSRRAEAREGLLALQQAQEKFRANCPTYATAASSSCTLGDFNGDGDTTDAGETYTVQWSNSSTYYTISVDDNPAATSTTYNLKAVAVNGTSQAADTGCTTMTVNQNGQHYGENGVSGTDDDTACW